ncbi:MAG TPA: M3 family metallopeptidase, partial [Candidatus Limnocylindrales bacterium]|nr:M3 family metallopeptidase [Candidatus Limnocylindrales bacterium]
REVIWAAGQGATRSQMTTDEAARAASFQAYEQIEKWRASLPARPDLVQAVEGFAASTDLSTLAADQRTFVERWRKDIRLAGGSLTGAARDEVARLTDRLIELGTAYLNNLATPKRFEVPLADLDGVPDACVASLERSQVPNKVEFVLSYPNYLAVLEQGRNRDLRKRVYGEWLRRGYPENIAILEEVLESRRRIAALLGYPSWQALRAENLASPGPEWTNAFIAEMTDRLRPIVAREQAGMTALLRSQAADPDDFQLQDWDWRFADQQQRAALGAGPDAVMPYLELDRVLAGLAELSEQVFGLRLVPHPERVGWDPEVRPFDLHDAATDRVLARLFVDPIAREGKQPGAWMEILLPGRPRDGVPPTIALVMNAPATAGGPTLLSVNEVETIFHEYGHVMNFACGNGRFALHNDAWLPFDFIEGPSSFVGRWALEPPVMERFARHHETGAPIPGSLMDALRRAQTLNHAVEVQRQFWLARLDALLHGAERISIDDAEAVAWPIRDLPFPEGSHISANLSHIASGAYHGALYGYAWSELIRDDLLARFEEAGVTDPEVGARYRETILEIGWVDDPVAAVNEFLGRPWSADAFLARAAEG